MSTAKAKAKLIKARRGGKAVLLSGGNPQIAKADGDARWIDIHEDDLNEAQMAKWVKQAAALPGWVPGRSP